MNNLRFSLQSIIFNKNALEYSLLCIPLTFGDIVISDTHSRCIWYTERISVGILGEGLSNIIISTTRLLFHSYYSARRSQGLYNHMSTSLANSLRFFMELNLEM